MIPETPMLVDPTEATMRRVEAQPALFAASPSRVSLHALVVDPAHRQALRVNVWRNHAIEPILALARPYLWFGRSQVDFRLSDYDDALGFADHSQADLELIWLDWSRYLRSMPRDEMLVWLRGRIEALRRMSRSPILLAAAIDDQSSVDSLQQCCAGVPGVHAADLAKVSTEIGRPLLDARSAEVAGTPVSGSLHAAIAREMACRWLPAATLPPIKAIVVDLDNTLHSGILGEDGVDGVALTSEHAALHRRLKDWKERGIFLALLSRNERADVEELFARREDYPLRWSDFAATEVSWEEKSRGILRIAEDLRIAPSAMLFVDDNPGELVSVATNVPGIALLHASDDPCLTRRAIDYYPGLWRWRVGADDAKRISDLAANAERSQLLAGAIDQTHYLQSLQVSLSYHREPRHQLDRLVDLCSKTNQFNLAMRRFAAAELSELMDRVDANVTSIGLRDRLADSGIIGVVVATRTDDCVTIEELCVSCRALGRTLEDAIVIGVIRSMEILHGCSSIRFRVARGSRNSPARDWLEKHHGASLPEQGAVSVPIARVLEFSTPSGVSVVLS